MRSADFKCTFLSDVILNSNTATEGTSQSLHYIPGSNFLGIVAKGYKSFGDSAFDIFHSGKVRFGDAHLSINDHRSLKMPASWFFEKSDEVKNRPYVHHYITDGMREDHRKDGVQLKQVRSGFFAPIERQEYEIESSFSIKSAYDKEKRRSADEQLYGYDALPKGSQWIFSVNADSEELLGKVKSGLIGKKNIGRSRSAQYGRVKIDCLDNWDGVQLQPVPILNKHGNNILVIYFESCALFCDEYGEPTFQPSSIDLKLSGSNKICWADSQTLTRSFSPWNSVRKTRDCDRVCIDKGSVIVVEIDADFNLTEYTEKLKDGIGLYRQEGFGRVLLNPEFLSANSDGTCEFELQKHSRACKEEHETIIESVQEKDNSDQDILDWIDSSCKSNGERNRVVELTNRFIGDKDNYNRFKGISASQWGCVRERVTRSKSFDKEKLEELFGEPKEIDPRNKGGFLRRGKSEKMWRNCWKTFKDTVVEIENKDNDKVARLFLINLCSEMAKKTRDSIRR